jgi:hypothetical protein
VASGSTANRSSRSRHQSNSTSMTQKQRAYSMVNGPFKHGPIRFMK